MLLPRFYPILDTQTAERYGMTPEQAAATIIEAGAKILQFRHKGFWSREVVEALQRVAMLCHNARVQFVVNDRADLARLVGGGLHLGQDDLRPSEIRAIVGAGAMVGYSTHDQAQLRAAESEPADYLALGPMFGTVSKANPDPVVGLDELRRLRPFTQRPLVAIGGITRSNAAQVLAAGADSVAVIGDLFPDVRARTEEWLATTKAR
jgi:thiamine-phosphate pyrophosphorylase